MRTKENYLFNWRRRLLKIGAVLIVGTLVVLSLLYVRYSQSQSNETAADIPGMPVITVPADTTMTTRPMMSVEGPMISPAPATPTPTPMPQPPRNPTAVITGVDGRKASGDVTIITTSEGTFIRLEDNFDSSRAAPDNRVYLGDATGRQIEIAKLKAPSGGQNFRIPDSVNIKDYTYIWIHCKAYNTTYGSGEITF